LYCFDFFVVLSVVLISDMLLVQTYPVNCPPPIYYPTPYRASDTCNEKSVTRDSTTSSFSLFLSRKGKTTQNYRQRATRGLRAYRSGRSHQWRETCRIPPHHPHRALGGYGCTSQPTTKRIFAAHESSLCLVTKKAHSCVSGLHPLGGVSRSAFTRNYRQPRTIGAGAMFALPASRVRQTTCRILRIHHVHSCAEAGQSRSVCCSTSR
jgi:hypothetical protein